MSKSINAVISFCNSPTQVANKSNLLIVDIFSGEQKWIVPELGGNGFTGLTQNNEIVFAVHQPDKTRYPGIVLIDKRNYEILHHQSLQEAIDPHSIAVDGDVLYVVSSGADSILQYRCDWTSNNIVFEKVYWKPVDSEGVADTHHVNSIFISNNQVYVSAFGPKKAETWSSADDGYIFNISKARKEIAGIYHPHSVLVKNGSILYCESSKKKVKKNNKSIIELETGYTRGLFVNKTYLFLGTSSGRRNSKSTGLINNVADPGSLQEDCRLLIYKKPLFRNQYTLLKNLDYLPDQKEIYDILVYSL